MAASIMSDDRFEVEERYEERSSSGGCLKGCLIAGVVVVILAVIAGLWIKSNLKNWGADFGAFLINAVIDQSDLPAQEKEEIKEQIARVTNAVKDGSITEDQLKAIFEGLGESPLMSVIMVAGIEHKYFDQSGLEDAEKEAGRLALRRFMQGALGGEIEESVFDEVMSPLMEDGENGDKQLKESVTDQELLDLFELAREKADAAGIPEDVPEVDPSDEMRRIIDEALEGGGAEEVEAE